MWIDVMFEFHCCGVVTVALRMLVIMLRFEGYPLCKLRYDLLFWIIVIACTSVNEFWKVNCHAGGSVPIVCINVGAF